MPSLITIYSVYGYEPYDLFLCDETKELCVFVGQITDNDIPYQFEPPIILKDYTSFVVKIIDSRPCEINSNII